MSASIEWVAASIGEQETIRCALAELAGRSDDGAGGEICRKIPRTQQHVRSAGIRDQEAAVPPPVSGVSRGRRVSQGGLREIERRSGLLSEIERVGVGEIDPVRKSLADGSSAGRRGAGEHRNSGGAGRKGVGTQSLIQRVGKLGRGFDPGPSSRVRIFHHLLLREPENKGCTGIKKAAI